MGFGVNEPEEDKEINRSSLTPIIGEKILTICDEVIFFNKLSDADLKNIYQANVDYYMNMYQNVDIDSKKLQEEVLKDAKNGHDVISRLASEVPRQVFKQLTKEKTDGIKTKVKVPKKNRKNDSQCAVQGLECNQDSNAH
jgi:hypothetical protein